MQTVLAALQPDRVDDFVAVVRTVMHAQEKCPECRLVRNPRVTYDDVAEQHVPVQCVQDGRIVLLEVRPWYDSLRWERASNPVS